MSISSLPGYFYQLQKASLDEVSDVVWQDVGSSLAGTGHKLEMHVSALIESEVFRFRIVPSEREEALIAEGLFIRGNPSGSLFSEFDEAPRRAIFLNSFYISVTEVTRAKWDQVREWAVMNRYNFNRGEGDSQHPVTHISWLDAVKWYNARSEMEGRTPVYYEDSSYDTVYRSGVRHVSLGWTNFEADGYRLPTEAEWEKAAGSFPLESEWDRFVSCFPVENQLLDANGVRLTFKTAAEVAELGPLDRVSMDVFPWRNATQAFDLSELITGEDANFLNSGDPFDPDGTTPVRFYSGGRSGAKPCRRNFWGLYDMAGNVSEWCYDWYDAEWYGRAFASADNVRGPESGSDRVIRGGSYLNDRPGLRIANREKADPTTVADHIGFRKLRNAR